MQDHSNRSLPVIGSIAVTALLVGGFSLWIQTNTVDVLQNQLNILASDETTPIEEGQGGKVLLQEEGIFFESLPGIGVNYSTNGVVYIQPEKNIFSVGEPKTPYISVSANDNSDGLSLESFVRERALKPGEFDGFDASTITKITMLTSRGGVIEGIHLRENDMFSKGGDALLFLERGTNRIIHIYLAYDEDYTSDDVKKLEKFRETMRIAQ